MAEPEEGHEMLHEIKMESEPEEKRNKENKTHTTSKWKNKEQLNLERLAETFELSIFVKCLSQGDKRHFFFLKDMNHMKCYQRRLF